MFAEKVLMILLLVCMSALPVFSQNVTVKGKVVDNNGRGLEGVKVTMQDPGRGRVVITLSSETGLFTLNDLKAGKYDISFSLPGFEDKVEKQVEVVGEHDNSILVRMQEKRKEKKKLKNETQR